MRSFRERLANLSTQLAPAKHRARPQSSSSSVSQSPTLDDLRGRIAAIIARGSPLPRTPRADPSRGELPFFIEETPAGPLYVRRVRSTAVARVGRVPLWPARVADAEMLGRLALDPRIQACDPARALYVDTETTGLAGGTGTVAFLIGLAWFEPDGALVVEQLLLRRLGEEAPILDVLARRLRDASMIVSFNGKSFDLPLLRTRFVMNRLDLPPLPAHLDLVHVARRVHKETLQLRTLASIEHSVLGHGRVGDVCGADIVAAYGHFLRSGDEGSLLGVVEHNAQDVLSMVALTGLYGDPAADLGGRDLAGVARTLRRAGDLERAAEVAHLAVERGGGASARRARADVARARGDKDAAIGDYEAALDDTDDPSLRLVLAKLYEHHKKAPARALALAKRGTGETEEALVRRLDRLRKKSAVGSRQSAVSADTRAMPSCTNASSAAPTGKDLPTADCGLPTGISRGAALRTPTGFRA